MITHFSKMVLLNLLALVLLSAFGAAQQAAEQKMSSLSFLIVRDANGKPVKNAEVILHLLSKDGKMKQEGLELKTHDDGKAETTGIPYGRVRVQVIAQGFRTYGEDFDINQPSMEFTIKLQKPKEQFSIYK